MTNGLWNTLVLGAGAFCFALAIDASAQSASTRPSSAFAGIDDGSSKLVLRALQLLGNEEAYASMKDVTLRGSCRHVHAKDDTDTDKFVWIFAGREYRYENNTAGRNNVMVSGHGHASSSISDDKTARTPKPQGTHFQVPLYLPGLVLYRATHNPRATYSFTTPTPDSASPATSEVKIQQIGINGQPIPSSEQDWYFNSAGLPSRVDVFIAADIPGQRPLSIEFGAYKLFANVLVPSQMTTSTAGQTHGTCTITDVDLNTSPSSDVFDLPKKQ